MKKEEKEAIENSQYAKSHFGLCKNKGCFNKKRDRSSYCEDCSIKHKKLT